MRTLLCALLVMLGCDDGAGSSAADAEPDQGPHALPDSALPDAAPDAAEPPASHRGEWLSPEATWDAVDPFVGSGGIGYGYAGLTPAAMRPNGLVKLGPDTTRDGVHAPVQHFSGYHFNDPQARGFSHVRLVGTGVADLGNLRVLPVREVPESPGVAYQVMDKASEVAAPGRYAVELPEAGVAVALTVTTRAGLHRYTALEAGELHLLIDATASVIDAGVQDAAIAYDAGGIVGQLLFRGSMTGRTRASTLWFDGAVRPEPATVRRWDEAGVADGNAAAGTTAGLVLSFIVAAGDTIELDFGVSYVDADQAAENLLEAAPGFDAVAQAAAAEWAEKLSLLEVAADTDPAVLTTLYSALYHVYMMPTRYDEGGRYRGLDGEVHQTAAPYYTDLSLWDSFRTLHPWLELNDPMLERDVLNSLLAMARDGGYVPRWPAGSSYAGSMIGSSADMLFAGGQAKGIGGVDYEEAYDALLRTAMGPTAPGALFGGRSGIEAYLELGYIPEEDGNGSVSRTLEYAYSDWALQGLAAALGRPEESDFAARAAYYQNLFDPEQQLFAPRARDGTFARVNPRINYMAGGPYVEGTAWHWRFSAFHDPDGLAALYPDGFLPVLDEFFESSQLASGPPNHIAPDPFYWHGNEPPLHAVWLYAHFGEWARLGRWVRAIQRDIYAPTPAGLPGNDDGGTLSAWYLFAAVGLFPVPGSDQYYLGPPLVEAARLSTGAGTLRVEAPGAPMASEVRRVWVDDRIHEGPTIDHATLLAAERLHFELVESP